MRLRRIDKRFKLLDSSSGQWFTKRFTHSDTEMANISNGTLQFEKTNFKRFHWSNLSPAKLYVVVCFWLVAALFWICTSCVSNTYTTTSTICFGSLLAWNSNQNRFFHQHQLYYENGKICVLSFLFYRWFYFSSSHMQMFFSTVCCLFLANICVFVCVMLLVVFFFTLSLSFCWKC